MSIYDGSSLAGWTTVGTSLDGTIGNPVPSFKVNGAGYAAINVPDVVIGKTEIRFDMRLATGSTPLANFAFFCSSTGKGLIASFEGRTSFSSSIEPLNSWTSWGAPTIQFDPNRKNWAVATWYSFLMRTRMVASQAQYQLVQILNGAELICLNWTNFTPQGTWFALHGDNGTGVNWDNVSFINPVAASGVAKLSNGSAASKVVFLDASTYKLGGQATPGADGSYTAQVNAGSYLVVAYGPDGYRPAAHLVTVS